MANIKDIARASGYSVATVSKAFNGYSDISDKAKNNILKIAKEMNYTPNANGRGLAKKRTNTIGIILDVVGVETLRHPFFSLVINYFKDEVEKIGYDIMYISNAIGQTNITNYLDHCRQRGVDGVFFACGNYEDEGIQQLVNSSIPSVTVEVKTGQINSVISNNFQGSYDAVKYLYDIGHRDIAHIAGTEITFSGRERRKGYIKAMNDLDLQVKDEYIIDGGYFNYESGYHAMEQFINLKNPPTGITIASDIMAFGALRAIYKYGLSVPGDFSIIGFDNLDLIKYCSPRLSSVAQDFEALGRQSARLLTTQIDNKETEIKRVCLPTKLIVRETCRTI